MKTKEEIEQLANEYANGKSSSDVFKDAHKNDFIQGYTQYQEDIANIIKMAIEYGYELRNNHKPINSGIDWVKEFNSLNKQD